VERLAARRGASFEKGRHALTARAANLLLVKPTTFMNLSGTAVQALMTRHGVRPDALVVVHDDLDLPLGRLRLKAGGGAGGQRGVQDVSARIGPAFTRVRVGIGRPPAGWGAERWVLTPFDEGERELVARVIEAAADAVDRLVEEGLERAMNVVNGLDLAADGAPSGGAPSDDAPTP
jgi:peptidyl-tRNA hydrolase, PTH1 family